MKRERTKDIKEFKQGDYIMLGQCGWIKVRSLPEVREGYVYLIVGIMGMAVLQELRFMDFEEFKYEEGETDE